MFSVSAQIDIAATPERVWQSLMDFASYRDWHPFVEMEGAAVAGQTVGFVYRNDPQAATGLDSTALITRVEAPHYFALEFGIKALALIEEWYALERTAGGTSLTHGVNFRGIISYLVVPFVRKRLVRKMAFPIQKLGRYLMPKRTKPKPNTFENSRRRSHPLHRR